MIAQPSGALRRTAVAFAAMLVCTHPGFGSAAELPDRDETPPPEQVAISGIINDAEDAEFRLDHGEGEITVEMAGWEWYEQTAEASAPLLNIGERVTVTGPVDEEFYRARRLEARTVYVVDRDTIYTGSPLGDDESAWDIRPMPSSPLYGNDPISIRLAGRIAGVEDQQFSLNLGASVVRIETGALIDDPLDSIGNQRLEIGDWVQVGGKLDDGFFQDRRLEALRITRIVGDETAAF